MLFKLQRYYHTKCIWADECMRIAERYFEFVWEQSDVECATFLTKFFVSEWSVNVWCNATLIQLFIALVAIESRNMEKETDDEAKCRHIILESSVNTEIGKFFSAEMAMYIY